MRLKSLFVDFKIFQVNAIGAVFFTLGAAVFVFGLALSAHHIYMRATSTVTNGSIASSVGRPNPDKTTHYSLVVSFHDEESTELHAKVELDASPGTAYRVGEQVLVMYQHGKPAMAQLYIPLEYALLPVLCLAAGLGFAMIGRYLARRKYSDQEKSRIKPFGRLPI